MGFLEDGSYIIYEPEQEPRYNRSYKYRYNLLKEGLEKGYLTKEEAFKRFSSPMFFEDEAGKRKYLKKLKEL